VPPATAWLIVGPMATRTLVPVVLAVALACTAAPSPSPSPPATAHAHAGPVEFLAWERASFERAASEDKLILINVIATWCHWCHVMDEQTFADPEVAALLAEHFVVIRVDSDARPDVSERYRAWGWPASAFLSPRGSPALNLRGYRAPELFAALLRELIAEHQRGQLRHFDARASDPTQPAHADRDASDQALVAARERARAQLDGYFDREGLGWSDPQKYPWPEPITHAFVRARVRPEPDEQRWPARALATLEAERTLIDPVDGGMYQYSVRGVWDRPHFEKIAMIQAGAIETYAHAAMVTGDPSWLEPARAVARYLIGPTPNPMQAPDGGFYTSQDADLRRPDGTTIVGEDYYARDAAGRRALGSPRIDTAVYADLNGLLIHALTELHRATGDPEPLAAAVRAGERLLASHRDPSGGFSHGPLATSPAPRRFYLADQANLGWAFVALHRVSQEDRWREAAVGVAEFMQAELAAPGGGFYIHDEDPDAVGVFAQRRIPLPENALAAQFLIELHDLVDGDGSVASPWLERARATLLALADPAEIAARGKLVGRYLIALDLYLAARFDLTVVAAPGDPTGDALWAAARGWWEPRATLERSLPGQRYPDLGRAAAYLCSAQACSRPIDDPARFVELAAEFTR
jgi:uncharacterized protein